MEYLTSSSVKCEINEENKEIIKRALCRELGIDYTKWGDNEVKYESTLSSFIFVIQISFDLLPDSKGYSVVAQIAEKRIDRIVYFLAIGPVIVIAIYMYRWYGILISLGWGIVMRILDDLVFYRWSVLKLKTRMKKVFKSTLKDF